jgi:hypothetical protein
MKIYTAVLLSSLLVTGCGEPTKVFSEKECRQISEAAESIMSLRQSQVPITKTLDSLGKIYVGKGEYSETMWTTLIKPLIYEAYTKPAFSTEGYQEKAKSEFSNEVYLACVKS